MLNKVNRKNASETFSQIIKITLGITLEMSISGFSYYM